VSPKQLPGIVTALISLIDDAHTGVAGPARCSLGVAACAGPVRDIAAVARYISGT
jgi:hypothetical protein